MPYDYCALIGRFQPFHNEHLALIKKSLTEANKVILLIGSHKAAPNFRNPWSFHERQDMINASLPLDIQDKVLYVPIRDFLYNDNLWISQVQQKVREATRLPALRDRQPTICLGGTEKDATSYYLSLFPQWKKVTSFVQHKMDATTIRRDYFSGGSEWEKSVPAPVVEWLNDFKTDELYKNIAEEAEFVKGYKKLWEAAPFPPTFVTTDAVVTCAGHVLVVKRGHNPGKGLFALPGGFIDQDSKVEDNAIRELYEETNLKLPKGLVRDCIKEKRVFDHPSRSLRGRTITHAFHISLDEKELPHITAGDDASEAHWLSLADLYENESRFFEDHLHIINHFIHKE